MRHAIARLDLQIELRDIHDEPKHLEALLAARGRRMVPVLRIAGPEGDTWMPESADIIAYLRERFGK